MLVEGGQVAESRLQRNEADGHPGGGGVGQPPPHQQGTGQHEADAMGPGPVARGCARRLAGGEADPAQVRFLLCSAPPRWRMVKPPVKGTCSRTLSPVSAAIAMVRRG